VGAGDPPREDAGTLEGEGMKRLAFLPALPLWNLSPVQTQDPWEAWLWRVA